MKKVLFATTALVASAGVASADVALSGMAEMGIIGGDGIETQFWTDIDVTFTLSGETDNGLSFGATIDLDEEGGFGGTNGGPESVFISGDFGKLTMGDTDGAMDWALSESALGGDIADASTAHVGNSYSFSFTGGSALDGLNDSQVARYEYSFGDFAFAVSAEIDDTGVFDPTFGIGATYGTTMGDTDLSIGLAYQVADGGVNDITGYGVSVQAELASGLTLAAEYEALEAGASELTHFGLGVSYSWDALTVAANYGSWDANFVGGDQDGFGLSAAYDLGGGAVVQLGYGSSDLFGTAFDTDSFSFGVAMSF